MAMSADVLGPLIQSNIDALTDDQKKNRPEVFKAMAAAIIAHIQETAQIEGLAIGLVAPPSGGPVTGTLTVAPGSIK